LVRRIVERGLKVKRRSRKSLRSDQLNAENDGCPPILIFIALDAADSFRVGAALDMTDHGIDLVPIMHAGGWRSPEMVVRYTQRISYNSFRYGVAESTDGPRRHDTDAVGGQEPGKAP
jgi:hypothetical protein